jgi:hypothetical protein
MKVIARGLSFIFHPLFVLTYMTLILLWTNPFSFGWRHVAEADTLLIIMVMTTITLPGIAVLMMKMLGWVKSFELESQAERIGPFLVAGVMYLSLYLHVTHAETFPVSLRIAVLGTLISLWGCFFINMFTKVSLHATGMGGLVAIALLTKWVFGYDEAQIGLPGGANLVVPVNILLYIIILIAGIVCTSRLIVKAHERRDIYAGFILGFASIMISWLILK